MDDKLGKDFENKMKESGAKLFVQKINLWLTYSKVFSFCNSGWRKNDANIFGCEYNFKLI